MTKASRQRGAQEARTRMAYKIMQEVYERGQADGQSRDQIHLAIRAAYPWGERRAWPYNAWLLGRREFYQRHGLPLRPHASIAKSLQAGAA